MINSTIKNIVLDGNGVRVFVDFKYLDNSIKTESFVFDSEKTFLEIQSCIENVRETKEENLQNALNLYKILCGE